MESFYDAIKPDRGKNRGTGSVTGEQRKSDSAYLLCISALNGINLPLIIFDKKSKCSLDLFDGTA
jgi:hypothetical protein